MIDTLMALVVEVIRDLWDRGLYRQNPTLKRIHDHWFDVWVSWRTDLTMKDVDRQIEEIREPSGVDKPIFIEEADGETLLGGPMEIKAPWMIGDRD